MVVQFEELKETLSLWARRASSVAREKILCNEPSLLCSDDVNEQCDVARNLGAEKNANSRGHFFLTSFFTVSLYGLSERGTACSIQRENA